MRPIPLLFDHQTQIQNKTWKCCILTSIFELDLTNHNQTAILIYTLFHSVVKFIHYVTCTLRIYLIKLLSCLDHFIKCFPGFFWCGKYELFHLENMSTKMPQLQSVEGIFYQEKATETTQLKSLENCARLGVASLKSRPDYD